MPGGRIPRREGWNGLVPVPGDGRCEWEGFLPAAEYPERVNPQSGYAFSANEMNLPADWPHGDKQVGFDWNDRARADRIIEAFARSDRHGVDEARRLQNDETSLPARALGALLAAISAADDDGRAAIALLRNFDGRLASDSASAALFEIWWTKHLKPALFRRAAGDPAVAGLLAPGDADAVVAGVSDLARFFGGDVAARDALVVETLGAAYREARDLLGADAGSWAWGRLHHGYFPHPLAGVAEAQRSSVPDIGPLPMGGSGQTVKLASYRPSDFRVMHGASFRLIVDLANLDRSLCVNAPGQSGDPRSRHYDQLAATWAASDYAPMLYSRDAVDQATEYVWRLKPV